jgi:CRP-like cAMP-binding protein
MARKVSLEESWLFAGLPGNVLARIRALAGEERYPASRTIFSEGDLAQKLYILGEGEVELSYVLPCRTPVTMRIARIAPGEIFGWSALARGEKLTADARALTDSAAYLIPAAGLIEVLDSDPPCGYRVMTRLAQLIAKRLRDTRTELRWIQSSL